MINIRKPQIIHHFLLASRFNTEFNKRSHSFCYDLGGDLGGDLVMNPPPVLPKAGPTVAVAASLSGMTVRNTSPSTNSGSAPEYSLVYLYVLRMPEPSSSARPISRKTFEIGGLKSPDPGSQSHGNDHCPPLSRLVYAYPSRGTISGARLSGPSFSGLAFPFSSPSQNRYSLSAATLGFHSSVIVR